MGYMVTNPMPFAFVVQMSEMVARYRTILTERVVKCYPKQNSHICSHSEEPHQSHVQRGQPTYVHIPANNMKPRLYPALDYKLTHMQI